MKLFRLRRHKTGWEADFDSGSTLILVSPVLWKHHATGAVEALSNNGIALGLSSNSKYRFGEREIETFDRFLLYTDGLLEARNAEGLFYGGERLCEMLVSNVQPIDTVVNDLMTSLSGWAGYGSHGAQEDDLTLIGIEVK